MTAANAGARVTGWGFVVFTIGSIAWSVMGSLSGQGNLLVTNLFLTVVNAVGVWRWLGREATYETGSSRAVRKSSRAHAAPTLFSASQALGAELTDPNGQKLGVVVDLMLRRDQRSLCYVVIAHHGIGGVGETLRAVDPAELDFADGVARTKMSVAHLDALPALQADNWPSAFPSPGAGSPGGRRPE